MILVLISTIAFLIILIWTWKFQQFNKLFLLLDQIIKVRYLKDEINQQKLLLTISKKMMIYSLLNIGLFLFWLSPFIFCYLMVGTEAFFKMYLSRYSLIIFATISFALYLKYKVS
jgi:hypothetical protein